jgi:hypothetical protein
MLGKRREQSTGENPDRVPITSYQPQKSPFDKLPLVTTKFRFREHYIKNLSNSNPGYEDTIDKPPEQPAFYLPDRGSLTRMSFWAYRRPSNQGEIAYFKCTLPEQVTPPITREQLKGALVGLARNQAVFTRMRHQQPLPQAEVPKSSIAEKLEKLRNEMSADYQRMNSGRQNPQIAETSNAEVRLPSPTDVDVSKPRRKLRNEAQYKFEDFIDLFPNRDDSQKEAQEISIQPTKVGHVMPDKIVGQSKGRTSEGQHRSVNQGISISRVLEGGLSDEAESGINHNGEEESLSPDYKDPQNEQDLLPERVSNSDQFGLVHGHDFDPTEIRENPRTNKPEGVTYRQSSNEVESKKTKRKFAGEVNIFANNNKIVLQPRGQAGRMMTRRHSKGLQPEAVRTRPPRTRMKRIKLVAQNEEKKIENEPASNPRDTDAPNKIHQQHPHHQIQSLVMQNFNFSQQDPMHILQEQPDVSNEVPQPSVQLQRRSQPQAVKSIQVKLANQHVPAIPPIMLNPPKQLIFDPNSADYLRIFKTNPRLQTETPPNNLEVEEPYVIPDQNLPVCDSRLSISQSFDYNAQISHFTGQNEKNRLSYQESYQWYLAHIFQHGAPVCSIEYRYKGKSVHTFDTKVLQMIKSLFDSGSESLDGLNKTVESVIRHTDTITNEHPSFVLPGSTMETNRQGTYSGEGNLINNQLQTLQQPVSTPAEHEIATKELELALKHNAFRYILIKFSLDIELKTQDLVRLNPYETHMLVAFFNVKFGISDTADRLFQNDTMDRILSIANKFINRVYQRTQNFKKNEEFLKKKWKEFLKFVKNVFKDECGSAPANSKGTILLDQDSNKPQLNRLIYEKYHRPCVLKKMSDYQNDPNRFRKCEWSVMEDIRWPAPDTESTELNKIYSETEIQFMKVFFSVKA